jgi:hypothetical protein
MRLEINSLRYGDKSLKMAFSASFCKLAGRVVVAACGKTAFQGKVWRWSLGERLIFRRPCDEGQEIFAVEN